ncbi:fungal-specific transcription factor domain-containing protein [Mycena maculata]|uniref:Fungal-specific transcription factor domain-containing protein n=1 Tax=Mycena maculata TaxID=230809 RepID=A0AAD7HL77_9AGAR|nr:fungal-specific transcription factor domain-containing protein [Mycena maculata]
MPAGTEDQMRSAQNNGKRRRLQGSCDLCRKKKVRCDSAEMPGNRCTNCITLNTECTHARLTRADSDKSPASTTQSLKTAQEHVANILSTSTVYIPSDDHAALYRLLVEVAKYARSLEQKVATLQPQTPVPVSTTPLPGTPMPVSLVTTSPPTLEACSTLIDAIPVTDEEQWSIEDSLTSLIPSGAKKTDRFYGKSSSVEFVKAAIKHIHGGTVHIVGIQRPEFWTVQPWEKLVIEPPQYFFPDNDLLKTLVKIYFEQINPILGILHSPSFYHSISDALHFRDPHFAAVVLAVCSVASRYSDDPRVFLEGTDSEMSCGWKWFRQVRPLRASFTPAPSLHQLQLICLSIVYLAGTFTPEECWIYAGLGIRFAQGAGAHLRGGQSDMKPLDAELYKRIFWILVTTDTIMSSFKGRPSSTRIDDINIDMPVDCDEEYWGLPNAVQPRGKPSSSAFLVAYLKLMLIFSRIQNAIYPVNGQTSQDLVVELDSALNNWVDIIPDHLRWDPNQKNQIFLDQSAALYALYYHAQIVMHRRFIPAPGKAPEASNAGAAFPSLAICANAARSCGHVLDAQARHGRGLLHHPHVMTALFDSAVVLLVNVWEIVGGKKSRTAEDFNRATVDARNCVRVLRLYERRWRVAGRKCDIISALFNMGKHTPSLKRPDAPSLKRGRDLQEPPDALLVEPPEERPVAGSLGASSVSQQMQALELSIQSTSHLFSLPIHTEELGCLPVYDSFDYAFSFQSNDFPYQPQSHLDLPYGELGPIDPELVYGMDASVIGSNVQQDELGTVSGELPHSLDIPSGYDWQDWSTYLTGLAQGSTL